VSGPIPAHRRVALPVPVAVAGAAAAIALLIGCNQADGGANATTGHWTALQRSPLTRTEVGAARIGRLLYVLGGFVPPDGATTAQVARYDTDARTWSLVKPLPIAVNHAAVAVGSGRCRGDLYVYGGYAADGSLSGEVDAMQRYRPRDDSWTVLRGSGAPRGAATLASVGCSLYAIGGAHDGAPQRVVQVYDSRRDAWRPGPDMRVAREHLASVALGHRILVFGGRSAGRNLAVVEELDTRSGNWSRRPPMPTPRSGFGAAAVAGEAVVAGGEQLSEGDETIGTVEAYDPQARRWRKLPGMLTPRHGLGVVSRGRRVFAAEGGPQPALSYSAALEALDVAGAGE
jgi:hypothetical protein